jgi:hypothetical protein
VYTVGKFIVERECCAQLEGSRQTFSIHFCSPLDPTFVPLPMPSIKDHGRDAKKKMCSACNVSKAQKESFFGLALTKPCFSKDWVNFNCP